MSRKQRLELTWIGKEEVPRLEPRVLLPDDNFCYHEGDDLLGNRLVHGDNLLALKALEAEFTGKVKCIYIDPPYNTGSAFEHYEDGLEHSIWLTLMRDRLSLLHKLMQPESMIFVQIDDHEMAYLQILMDEIFGRTNRIATIAVRMSEASGVKMAHVRKKLPKLKEYVLAYRNSQTPDLNVERIPLGAWNNEYKTLLANIERSTVEELKEYLFEEGRTADHVKQCNALLSRAELRSLAQVKTELGLDGQAWDDWRYENAWRIVQAVGSSSVLRVAREQPAIDQDVAACLSATGIIYLYKTVFDREARQPRVQIIFADDNLMIHPGDFWGDIKTTGGVGQEGGVPFPNGKKPEALLRRIIQMCTAPGDLVLDSFAGSGTTGAVAHKMGRRWIMIEQGPQAYTHIVPRMQRVIDGNDSTGVTEAAGWKGGGGFRYFRLAPSLIERDEWGNEVISSKYNPAMLAEAMCKHMGFTYAPDPDHFWMQGRSTESDFIYVTTAALTHEQLKKIADLVGPKRTLLVCCRAFQKEHINKLENLTVRKIPHAILAKCEWGKDDYSMGLTEAPSADDDEVIAELATAETETSKPRKRKKPFKTSQAPSLFDEEGKA